MCHTISAELHCNAKVDCIWRGDDFTLRLAVYSIYSAGNIQCTHVLLSHIYEHCNTIDVENLKCFVSIKNLGATEHS